MDNSVRGCHTYRTFRMPTGIEHFSCEQYIDGQYIQRTHMQLVQILLVATCHKFGMLQTTCQIAKFKSLPHYPAIYGT